MDFFTETPAPSYYIYRDGSANEPFDPTAPLQFFPPKDSDELFFALRTAYPNVSTHSERMRNAVIEFLMNEGQAQQQVASSQTSPVMPVDNSMMYESASTSSYSPYISMASSSSASMDGSPEITALSPALSQPVQRTNSQASVAPSQNGAPLDQMTSVFSLTSHSQPKLRTRRKMTEAEKIEYRKRRSAGACQSCVARKRKCKHTKDAASSVTTTTTTGTQPRVVKPLSRKLGKQVAPPTAPVVSTGPPLSSNSLLSFDNASDDLMSFNDAELFPWKDDADWTLLDFNAPLLPDFSFDSRVPSRPSDDRTSPDGRNLQQGLPTLQHGFGHTDLHLLDAEVLSEPVVNPQQPTHTLHTHIAQSPRHQPDLAVGHPGASIATGNYLQERLGYKSAGPSGEGRGVVDGAHDYSPTLESFMHGTEDLFDTIATNNNNARGLSSARKDLPRQSVLSGQRATVSHPRLVTESPLRTQAAGIATGLPVDDAIAAASVKERQSLTLRDSGQKPLPENSVPQDSSGIAVPWLRSSGLISHSAGSVVPTAGHVAHASGRPVRPSGHAVQSSDRAVIAPSHVMTSELAVRASAGLADNHATEPVSSGVRHQTTAPDRADVVHTRPRRPSSSGSSTDTSSESTAVQAVTTPERLKSGSFTNDHHDIRLSLETFLIAIGEIQKCILCAMVSSLPAVRVTNDTKALSPPLAPTAKAMDELTSLCSSMQIAAA
ncbi:Hypothetical protein D9617_2g058800 [Elsinoe fawcettii]|nr:Hypothetical protein D9617_2g058800 [Elsinoe fawcettii]